MWIGIATNLIQLTTAWNCQKQSTKWPVWSVKSYRTCEETEQDGTFLLLTVGKLVFVNLFAYSGGPCGLQRELSCLQLKLLPTIGALLLSGKPCFSEWFWRPLWGFWHGRALRGSVRVHRPQVSETFSPPESRNSNSNKKSQLKKTFWREQFRASLFQGLGWGFPTIFQGYPYDLSIRAIPVTSATITPPEMHIFSQDEPFWRTPPPSTWKKPIPPDLISNVNLCVLFFFLFREKLSRLAAEPVIFSLASNKKEAATTINMNEYFRVFLANFFLLPSVTICPAFRHRFDYWKKTVYRPGRGIAQTSGCTRSSCNFSATLWNFEDPKVLEFLGIRTLTFRESILTTLGFFWASTFTMLSFSYFWPQVPRTFGEGDAVCRLGDVHLEKNRYSPLPWEFLEGYFTPRDLEL